MEVMKQIPDNTIDLILCDPPFGTTANRWDKPLPFDMMWAEYERIIKEKHAIVLFALEPYATKLKYSNFANYKYDWIWDKHATNGFLNAKRRPLKRYENICVFSYGTPVYYPQMEIRGKERQKGAYNKKSGDGDGVYRAYKNISSRNNVYYPTDILSYSNAKRKGKVHSAQKPTELLEYLIRTYTRSDGPEPETVLDNCMGSGSTGVARIHTNRNFIGIELDTYYYNIARDRINEAKENAWKSSIKTESAQP